MFRMITLGTVSLGVLRTGMFRTRMVGGSTSSAAPAAHDTNRIRGSYEDDNDRSPDVVHTGSLLRWT